MDFKATLRALWQNTRQGRRVSGGSTLTQQLARALSPRPRTLWGKAREALGAFTLEKNLDKAEILEEYLNRAPYGPQLTGAEAASRAYFGVPAAELSLAQAALLAGIPKSPARYDPARRPGQARARQERILKRLKELGWVDEDTWKFDRAEKIEVLPQARPFLAPHFTGRLAASGEARITTTLDAGLQGRLQELTASHVARLKGQNVTNGALVVLDNRSGEVLAWVGSADFRRPADGQVDGVLAPRQPGSTLKPFVYGLGLARGMRTSDILEDLPIQTAGGFSPRNYDQTYHGLVRLREALANSYNVPAIRAAESYGAPALLAVLRAAGFKSLDRSAEHYGLGLALGNGEVTLLELADAYAALARGGAWLPARTIKGEPPAEPARRVLDRESAYLITHILSDNAARAEAFGLNSPLHLPFPFAAKTGTTKDYRDNLAAGYTPDWTVAVWVGNFDGSPMRKVSGITGAAPLLKDAALAVAERLGTRPFPVPAGIREIEVCPVSGKTPGAWCPDRILEVFSSKHPPDGPCRSHGPEGAPAAPAPKPLAVEFPMDGAVFRLDPSTPRGAQVLRLKATVAEGDLTWKVDGELLPATESGAWWPLKPGKHAVEVSRSGEKASARFLVLP